MTLDWRKVWFDNSGGTAARLEGRHIDVRTEYLDGKCNTAHFFRAFIPVAVEVAPKTSEQVCFEISQIPSFSGPGDKPSTVWDFQDMNVSVNPSNVVFPKKTKIIR
jgi:hypothetical protein